MGLEELEKRLRDKWNRLNTRYAKIKEYGILLEENKQSEEKCVEIMKEVYQYTKEVSQEFYVLDDFKGTYEY